MTKITRGRPAGTSPHRKEDQPVLEQAALLLTSGRSRSPTRAFRDILKDVDDRRLRRLQRAWKREGDRLLEALQGSLWELRWQVEAEALEQSAPEVFARIRTFAQSDGAVEVLPGHLRGASPARLMSLGIVKLWEMVEGSQPRGSKGAESAFARSLENWTSFGVEADAPFLRRFAVLCLERAAALETSSSEEPGKGERL